VPFKPASVVGVISKYLRILEFPFPVLAVPVLRVTTVELSVCVVSVISSLKPPKVTVPLVEPVFLVADTEE